MKMTAFSLAPAPIDNVIIVYNKYEIGEFKVINQPFTGHAYKIQSTEVGVWKIKQLKKNE